MIKFLIYTFLHSLIALWLWTCVAVPAFGAPEVQPLYIFGVVLFLKLFFLPFNMRGE